MIRFGAVLAGVGVEPYEWLAPDVPGDASINIEWLAGCAEEAEAHRFDFLFVSDALFIDQDSLPFMLARFEPMTLLAALAMRTRHIGLVATMTTSYAEPYNVARAFQSIDLLSGGRAGWNVVTTAIPGAALNFSQASNADHEERYQRAEEFLEVVRGLWDSYEDDAFVRDKASRRFLIKEKQHRLDFAGRYFQVQGPLSSPRSAQGHPVIFQAGQSDTGRDFAARQADAVFTLPSSLAAARDYYADIKDRARASGKDPAQVSVIVGINPMVDADGDRARARYAQTQSHISIEDCLRKLKFVFGHDFTGYDLDAPFPEAAAGQVNGYQGQSQAILDIVEAEHLTLRGAAHRFGIPDNPFVGSPLEVADELQRWFEGPAADGFNIVISSRARFRSFADTVLPILRERGLARSKYEGGTLRDNLGLDFVANRHAASAGQG